jgi:hypothetical protein
VWAGDKENFYHFITKIFAQKFLKMKMPGNAKLEKYQNGKIINSEKMVKW